jgi:hypothetical protein
MSQDRVPTLRSIADLPDALADKNLGLFIDGHRVDAKGTYERSDANIYTVTFEVPHALADGTFSDSEKADLWGGWRVGDMASVYPLAPGEKESSVGRMGLVKITDILAPKAATATANVKVNVEALGPVYDGTSATPLIESGETGVLPITWLQAVGELFGH